MKEDREALFIEALLDEYAFSVKAMAKYILNDDRLAEKALRMTFDKIVANRKIFDRVDDEDSHRLVVVFLRCACFEILRGKRKIDYSSKVVTPESSGDYGKWTMVHILCKKSTLCWLKNTLTSFGSPFTEICILKFYFSLDIKAIAKVIGMNRFDVFAVLHRYLAKLKNATDGFVGADVPPADLGLAIALSCGDYVGEEFSRMKKFDVSKVRVSEKIKVRVFKKLKFSRLKPLIVFLIIALLVISCGVAAFFLLK